MIGGSKLADKKIVLIATKSNWDNCSPRKQNNIIIHELGHIFNMTVEGANSSSNPTKLDGISTFYDTSKGHKGRHCHAGIPAGQMRYDSRADLASSTCVMYGCTNNKHAFCIECANVLRKAELIL